MTDRKTITLHTSSASKRYPRGTGEVVEAPAPPKKAEATGTSSETGGPSGPEPTRYGDWERDGRCVDF